MGILDPDYFLGGRSSLNKAKAEEYIRKTIAEPLGLDVAEAAAGVYDIINAKMADLIRRQVIRQGYLPEEFVLYCFGGAGPVHLAGFAEELGIKQAFIFRPSAVFSAFGAAAADVIHTRMLSVTYALPMEPEVLNDTLRGIEHELTEAMADEGFSPDQIVFQRYFSMRYRRQTTGVEVPVQWSSFSNQEMEDLQRLFEGTYEELYGIGAGFTRAGIEINAIRVDAIGPVSKPVIEHHAPGGVGCVQRHQGIPRRVLHPAGAGLREHPCLRIRRVANRQPGGGPGSDRNRSSRPSWCPSRGPWQLTPTRIW